jgi:hypothetical protein
LIGARLADRCRGVRWEGAVVCGVAAAPPTEEQTPDFRRFFFGMHSRRAFTGISQHFVPPHFNPTLVRLQRTHAHISCKATYLLAASVVGPDGSPSGFFLIGGFWPYAGFAFGSASRSPASCAGAADSLAVCRQAQFPPICTWADCHCGISMRFKRSASFG